MTELTVHVSATGGRCVLRLTGELDLDTVNVLRKSAQDELAAGRCRILTIDMSELTFLDSSGLGLLVDLHKLAVEAQLALEVANVPPRQARVFHIAGLGEMFGLPPLDAQPEG